MSIIFKLKLSWLLIFCVFCVGCFPDSFTKSDKILYTTNQVLQNAKDFRVLALQSAAIYYKQGLLSEAKKDKIIELGDQLQEAINVSVDALIDYQKSDYSNSKNVDDQMIIFNQLFRQFTDLVSPLMIDTHN